jgi:DNA repair photolyase
MKCFTGHNEEWGTFVDAKVNATEVLAQQMRRTKPGNVVLSTVTDAYQPLERKYQITRACLEVLTAYDGSTELAEVFPVSILTKSDLVLRDLDLLRRLGDVEVGFTIATLDEDARQALEPRASPVPARLAALAELSQAGIKTWVFCGPLLPYALKP